MMMMMMMTMMAALVMLPLGTIAAFAQGAKPFTDDTGFTVDLPLGWIANDYRNTGPDAAITENNLGYTKLVTFCNENDAAPTLGSEVPSCNISPLGDFIEVFRYKDLASKSEFASIVQSGREITANDVFLYYLEELKRYGKATVLPGASPLTPLIDEEFTRENVPIEVNISNPGQTVGTQATPLIGKIAMVNTNYHLFFIDPNTGYAYRVTEIHSSIVERDNPNKVLKVSDMIILSIIDSVRLEAPLDSDNISHPLFTYEPPTTPDYNDPGALVLASPIYVTARHHW
ncbi:MAG TPA: hypothetical protein VFS97_04335 [Nitrososphaeraceae archaeon]|nr:hypothetical protein [Nitrososphaeraceae archaeon]